MPAPDTMVVLDPDGRPHELDLDAAAAALESPGWRVQTDGDARTRLAGEAREETYGGVKGAIGAGAAAFARGATLGGSDVVISALGGADELRNLREQNQTVSTVAEIGGGIASSFVVPGGAASAVARGAEEAGALMRVGRAAWAGGKEGFVQGIGSGVSELALSENDLSVEQAVAALGSNALFGAGVGGIVGAGGKALELGLGKAKAAVDDVAARARSVDSAGDLAALDTKGLKAAEKAELDAIEVARVPRRAELSEEIASFRREMKEQKVWLATAGAENAELRAIGKRTLKADRGLDNLIDDPRLFAENPKYALSHLRKQEAALDELVTKHGDNLRVTFAADETGTRLAALDNAAKALESNRALQAKITDLASPASSERLVSIRDAREALATGTGASKKSLAEQLLGGSVFSMAAGAMAALPIPGAAMLAPLAGAKAATFVGEKVFGRMTKVSAEAAERASKGIAAFMNVTSKVAPMLPVVASRTLASVTFAPSSRSKGDRKGKGKRGDLPSLYRARTEEIRSQTMGGPGGAAVMRPEARARMAEKFSAMRTVGAPGVLLADRMETQAARGLTFLADRMPRRPDMGVLQTGPDQWQPSDMEMRGWARMVAAVEDPGGVIDRLAHGAITPEDVDVMRAVYPEQLADITRRVLAELPSLQKALPYHRRLALSMLTDVPVDPAMHPDVLAALQTSFTEEPGSEGGTQAPKALPAFGSVSAEPFTATQERSA